MEKGEIRSLKKEILEAHLLYFQVYDKCEGFKKQVVESRERIKEMTEKLPEEERKNVPPVPGEEKA